ncbi:hypothetical protein Emag_000879 [Eimeria magna]
MSPPVSSKSPPAAAAAAAAAAVPSIPAAAAGGTKGRAPRVAPAGASPKGRRHDGGDGEEASAAEAAAAAVLESIISAGAELLHKRSLDRKCFAFAAADAANTLLSILTLCHLTVDPGEPGDLGGPPADSQCTEGAPITGSPLLPSDAADGGAPLAPGLDEGRRAAEEGRLEGGPPSSASAAKWEGPPLPVPGPQDSWAPGCLGIKPLTPELLQQLELDDKKRLQQQAASLKPKPNFTRTAAAAAKAAAAKTAAGGQAKGAKGSPLPRDAAAAARAAAAPAAAAAAAARAVAAPAAAPAAAAGSRQGAGPLRRVTGGRGPTKEQGGGPPVQKRLSSSTLSEGRGR